ncbi:MAG: hypothetical protein MK171_12940 [Pirellulales bacterium]|nr:hypothetical protein [Pirellulales bacterium]
MFQGLANVEFMLQGVRGLPGMLLTGREPLHGIRCIVVQWADRPNLVRRSNANKVVQAERTNEFFAAGKHEELRDADESGVGTEGLSSIVAQHNLRLCHTSRPSHVATWAFPGVLV